MFRFMAGDKVIIWNQNQNKYYDNIRKGIIVGVTQQDTDWYIVECRKYWFFKEVIWVHYKYISKQMKEDTWLWWL